MLRTFTATSVAALVAATFSTGAMAQEWDQSQDSQMTENRADRISTDYSDKKIADVIKEEDRFSKFRKALKEADMEDSLSDSGSYTVFAPTNEAFERLPVGTWDAWMDGKNTDELRDLLSYHIIEETVMSDDIDEGDFTTKSTMDGGDVRLSANYGSVTVNHVNVAYADIETENGVVHGIDSVLFDTEQPAQRTSAL